MDLIRVAEDLYAVREEVIGSEISSRGGQLHSRGPRKRRYVTSFARVTAWDGHEPETVVFPAEPLMNRKPPHGAD